MIRRSIIYSGHVQGVGFRFTCRQLASRLGVTGFVRNLDDGRVQLVVEGDEPLVQNLLNSIDTKMSGYIEEADVREENPTGEFRTFEIRR